jgi:chaperonin GroES
VVLSSLTLRPPIQGEIVAVGKGKILESGDIRPLDVKAGDKVLFGKYAGTEVKVEGEELLVMREEDIMGVVEG